ncbi:sugar phosphate isomerase/epimerase [Variovorax sp. PAMC28562]|uniref:sugar phosphate isomerase/epimerase family protein n=1 Tax=Variovorax sp. PAMC28562 TaxID=2762323 RepID=UPI00164EC84D|nr:sugar phosphate isomerase/epimerase family protein [Variovorax sp. PAMC28562]QNK73508.1 sugar phosphate isomerase/epimerase [Variovorax sp. PAMC28562]
MKIALCNEVLAGMSLEKQCEVAAALGYDGLEVAPFTLSDTPEKITSGEAARIRATIESFGLIVTGLHWLLVKPEGLSLTDPDAALRSRTLEVMSRLTGLCAELGGMVLVHGSPKQRQIPDGESHAVALARLQDGLARVAESAAANGVIYCIEPLSPHETSMLNTVAQAAEVVRTVDHPNLRTMIDCSAAGLSESESVPDLIDRWLPTGLIGHIQVNDPNRRGPGQGAMQFAPIFAALKRHRYAGAIGVEPFDYVPDGPGVAAFSAGYLKGLREALA